MTHFAAVDTGDGRVLVAIMDATDRWTAVRAARAWVLEQVVVGLLDRELAVGRQPDDPWSSLPIPAVAPPIAAPAA